MQHLLHFTRYGKVKLNVSKNYVHTVHVAFQFYCIPKHIRSNIFWNHILCFIPIQIFIVYLVKHNAIFRFVKQFYSLMYVGV